MSLSNSLDPDEIERMKNGARHLFTTGEFSAAIVVIETLLMLQPSLDMFALRVTCSWELGDYQTARAYCAVLKQIVARAEIQQTMTPTEQLRLFDLVHAIESWQPTTSGPKDGAPSKIAGQWQMLNSTGKESI